MYLVRLRRAEDAFPPVNLALQLTKVVFTKPQYPFTGSGSLL